MNSPSQHDFVRTLTNQLLFAVFPTSVQLLSAELFARRAQAQPVEMASIDDVADWIENSTNDQCLRYFVVESAPPKDILTLLTAAKYYQRWLTSLPVGSSEFQMECGLLMGEPTALRMIRIGLERMRAAGLRPDAQ